MSTNELENMTLADLTGVDTSGMEARRMGEVLPRLHGIFECIKAEIKENKDPQTGKLKNFQAAAEWKLLGIKTLLDKGADEASLVGKIHFENRFITNVEGIKFALGYLEDVGIKERGQLGALWSAQIGKRVEGVVAHRRDPNDSDRVYSSLTKTKPIAA